MTDAYLPAENLNERDVVAGEGAGTPIYTGTVGHDDKADWYDQGTSGTNDPNGVTLVRVQLYTGRLNGTPIKPGVAQGMQVLAQLSGPLWRIPRLGERCLVALPGGLSDPGGAVIIGWLAATPATQFSPTRSKIDLGNDTDLFIKAKSITISDYDNRFIAIGPANGVVMQDKDGSGVVIKDGNIAIFSQQGGAIKTILQLTPADINALVNGGSLLQLTATKATLFGVSVYCQGGGVYVGAVPTAATPALWGLAGPAGVASTSVFVSP